MDNFGYIFAFKVLPTVVFFSAFTSLLYYLGILQKIVYVFAWIMSKTMKLSGAESLAAAANIFIGQTEAPLVVKPYLDKMTKSEILSLMVGGMATIAGGVLAAFISFLGGDSDVEKILFTQHLLTASIMSAPAALIIAKILYPQTEPEKVNTKLDISKDKLGTNILDASADFGSVAGSTTQVQYNSSGSFAGSANLVFDGTNLTAAGIVTAEGGQLTTTGISLVMGF